MLELLSVPWPWYLTGPLFGLLVPALLFVGGKAFGVSGSYRPLCAVTLPRRPDFFRYDWRSIDGWNLLFALGIVVGGWVAGTVLAPTDPVSAISAAARADIAALGITDFAGYVPRELIGWEALLGVPGIVMIVVSGFLVGFGARWAGGCTSGHGITGLATFQVSSAVAFIGFFIGGLFSVHVLLPLILL